jgi:hypothetical protein
MTTTQGAPTPAGASPGPLSPEHLAQIDAAQRRGKKIRKAARVASFNAWTAAIIGGTCLLGGVFDRTSLVLGIGITSVAVIEFQGAAKFRRLDLKAPMVCGLNQLFFLAIIATYCLWNMLQPSSALTEATGSAEADAMLADFAGLESSLMHGFYGLVLIGSILMQGLTAVYYFTRARHMRAFLRETPEWVVQLQRRAS